MNQKQIEEKKKQLSAEVANICIFKGTEAPFSGKFLNNKDKGMYTCVICGQELFSSETKYDSGTGWPSFWNYVEEGALKTEVDESHGMVRTEVQCSKCGAHLGHIFNDGPGTLPDGRQATGLRYCINSAALIFIPEKK